MKPTLLLTSLGLLCLLTACQRQNRVFDPPKKELVAANNTLALELFKNIYTAEKNQFISPYSISSALAMTYAGAAGITAEEMAKTLHFAGNTADFHKSFGDLQGTINNIGSGDNITIQTANKLFGSLDYQFQESFIKTIRDYYEGGFQRIDMADSESAAQTINDWVEAQTDSKIKNLVNPLDLGAQTSLALVNAIYFFGNWENAFKEEDTKERDFTTNKNEEILTLTMHAHQDENSNFSTPYRYHEDEIGQWLELPYKNDQASMVVLLPPVDKNIESALGLLSSEKLENSLKSLKKPNITMHISLPKWRTTYDITLNNTLIAMGMPSAFSPETADFSRLSEVGQSRLKIDAVLHKAFIEVSEKGTEAAAATIVIMSGRGMSLEPKIIFEANRPFMYFIKEKSTGSILFMGTMQNPNEE